MHLYLTCYSVSNFDDCICWCCIDNFPSKSSCADNDVDCGGFAHNHLQSTGLPVVSASTHLTVAWAHDFMHNHLKLTILSFFAFAAGCW